MKILIVDDHDLVRAALRDVLHRELGAAFEILEACSPEEALESAGRHADIELAIFDLSYPDGRLALPEIRDMRRRFPAVPILVLSGLEGDAAMRSVLDLGCAGYARKGMSCEALVAAVRTVLDGERYVPADSRTPFE